MERVNRDIAQGQDKCVRPGLFALWTTSFIILILHKVARPKIFNKLKYKNPYLTLKSISALTSEFQIIL